MGGYPIDASQAGSPAVASFMNAVYGWMTAGLALSGVVAWVVAANAATHPGLFSGPVVWGSIIVELILVMAIAGAVNRISAGVAAALFVLYSALNGVTLAGIFFVYTHATLAATFLITAGMFGITSIYGKTTHRDLSRMGSFLFMALIGLVLATVVNFFFANSMLFWIINYAGVFIFVGLTAYDTQKLQAVALQTASDGAMAARYSIVGALTLYLDFLNLFLFMLRILGNGERR
jgi:FtsH-binding integral membrane protein